ncbi:MAG: type II secretion system protein [bacterium]|nr:type II secretion system protein [bacterium]
MKHKTYSIKHETEQLKQASCFRFHALRSKGFTLIEMLVVIAIAGVLLAGVLVLFQGARTKGRDATREENIKTIQNALSLYVTNRGIYPVYDGYLTGSDSVSTLLKNDDALPAMPLDPLDSGSFRYQYISVNGATYLIKYYLETNTIVGKSAGLNQASP